jgi:hypothetical protein
MTDTDTASERPQARVWLVQTPLGLCIVPSVTRPQKARLMRELGEPILSVAELAPDPTAGLVEHAPLSDQERAA